jgi:hypothetical protein
LFWLPLLRVLLIGPALFVPSGLPFLMITPFAMLLLLRIRRSTDP